MLSLSLDTSLSTGAIVSGDEFSPFMAASFGGSWATEAEGGVTVSGAATAGWSGSYAFSAAGASGGAVGDMDAGYGGSYTANMTGTVTQSAVNLLVDVNADGTFTIQQASDSTQFDLTDGDWDTGSYTVDVGDGTDVLAILDGPEATESPAGTWTAKVGPVLYTKADGVPSVLLEWYAISSGTILSTAHAEGDLSYTEAGTEDTTGLGLRQRAINQSGEVSATVDLIALASYSEAGVIFDAADNAHTNGTNIAANATEAQSFVAFLSYEASGAMGSVGRMMDVNNNAGFTIKRDASNEGTVTIYDDTGASVTHTGVFAAGAGRYNILVAATWDGTNGLSAYVVSKKDSGTVDVSSELTMAAGSATSLALQAPLGIGGRSTGATTQGGEGTIFRSVMWVGTGAYDITTNYGKFFATDGSCQSPTLADADLGTAPVDFQGAVANAITGSHDGSFAALTVVGTLALA